MTVGPCSGNQRDFAIRVLNAVYGRIWMNANIDNGARLAQIMVSAEKCF